MKSFEVYFKDLNEETQKKLFDFWGVEFGKEELNQDLLPLFVIEFEGGEE